MLFLDELPEFKRDTLDVMRQPLEDGYVTISRASGSAAYPSEFMLVCAMNPCKCGWNGDPSGRCKCSQTSVAAYRGKISGPLLDRIDIIVEVPAVHYEDLQSREETESSASIKARVNKARLVQQERYKDRAITCNSRMGPDELREYCKLDKSGHTLMEEAFNDYGLTARSYDRILKVARTIADIEGSKDILPAHICEAIQYRTINI